MTPEELLLKQGHMEACEACSARFVQRWAECKAMDPPADLDTAMFESDASACPLGKWLGVTAEGVAAANALRREAHAVRFLKRFEPILKRLPNKRADFIAALDEMVNLQSAPGEKPINLSPQMRDAIVAALEKADA